MNKTAMIRARTQPELKRSVEEIFKQLGITPTHAINMFYHQVKLHKGLPFDISIPNETTIRTFQNTDKGKNITQCEDTEEMFKKLGI